MARPASRAVSRGREDLAWTRVQQGKTQQQIADELGVTQPAVSQMLARVEVRVLAKLEAAVLQRKARQQAILDHIVSEALTAWDASKQPRKKSSRKTKMSAAAKEGQPLGATKVEEMNAAENSHGDPRFLAEARQALADERKLWGLDAPVKLQPTPPDAGKLSRLTDAELDAHLDGLLVACGALAPAAPDIPPFEGASAAPVIDVTPDDVTPEARAAARLMQPPDEGETC